MDKKYFVSELDNLNIWQNFEKVSPQSSIYSSLEAIIHFKQNLKLYKVLKGEELKSLIYLYTSNNEVFSEPLIYSGLLFLPKKSQKNFRYLTEKFKITELIIEKVLSKYRKIDLNLHFNFEDVRPFLWHNYHEKDKLNYKINIRYTPCIFFKKNDTIKNIFENLDDVKKRDIKKCDQNPQISFDHENKIELLKGFYEETMRMNKGVYDVANLNSFFYFMEDLIEKKKGFQTNVYLKNKIVYSTFFSMHNNNACYLYGAGDQNIKDRLTGTYCLWKSIERSFKENMDLVDLEGANSPSRGSFKLAFGGDLKSYFNLQLNN